MVAGITKLDITLLTNAIKHMTRDFILFENFVNGIIQRYQQ